MTTTRPSLPDSRGRFGEFGGKYVPETLMPALAELEQASTAAWADESFHAEFDGLLAPSARWPCLNLVLFLDRLDPEATEMFEAAYSVVRLEEVAKQLKERERARLVREGVREEDLDARTNLYNRLIEEGVWKFKVEKGDQRMTRVIGRGEDPVDDHNLSLVAGQRPAHVLEDPRPQLIVPIGQRVAQTVRIGARGDRVKEIASHDFAPFRDALTCQHRASIDHDMGLVEENAAHRRIRGENRRKKGAPTASQVGQPAGPREVVRCQHRRYPALGDRHHGVIPARHPDRILTDVFVKALAVHVVEGRGTCPQRVRELAPRMVALQTQTGGPQISESGSQRSKREASIPLGDDFNARQCAQEPANGRQMSACGLCQLIGALCPLLERFDQPQLLRGQKRSTHLVTGQELPEELLRNPGQ